MQASLLFDDLSSTYNSVNQFMSFGLHNIVRQQAIRRLNLKNDKPKILDLFCGTGNNLPYLLSKYPYAKIDAVDASDKMMAKSTEMFSTKNVRFIHSDVLDYDFSLNEYDAIICSFGLKCIPKKDYQTIFEKLERISKPNAQIIFLDIFNGNQNWFNNLFFSYFKLVLRLHPKINERLRNQYLQLFSFMNRFDTAFFENEVQKIPSLQLSSNRLLVPLIKVYQITKK